MKSAHSRRPRLADVALAAGVSTMTVSRALSEPDRLHPKTLELILTKVAELGYVPSASARSLASKQSRMVAAIVPTLLFYARTIQGMWDGLRPAGFELLLGDSGYNARNEKSLVTAFLARGVDALVLTGVEHLRATRELVAAHALPTAEIWDFGRRPLGLTVGFSNREAGRAVGDLLTSIGRTRWAFMGPAPRHTQRSAKRKQGFYEAAQAAGLRRPLELLVKDSMLVDEAREAAMRFLRGGARIDAIFCVSDLLACAVLQVARQQGRRVPEDLAIVGFGDFEFARIAEPGLTTVRVHGYRMGRIAAESLLAQNTKRGIAERTVDVGFELIRRETA